MRLNVENRLIGMFNANVCKKFNDIVKNNYETSGKCLPKSTKAGPIGTCHTYNYPNSRFISALISFASYPI
jgi:hypothetical protein